MSVDPPIEASIPLPWRGIAAALLLVGAGGSIFYQTWQQAAAAASIASARAGEESTRAADLALRQKVSGFLKEEAAPLMAGAKAKDLAAVNRALSSLDACFASYGAGVDPFAHDLTAWGTRFKLIWRKGVETVKRREIPEGTAKLVREKFDKHVVSDSRLEADVMSVMRQFSYDLEADRNELLGSLQTRLAASDLPVTVKDVALTDFKIRYEEQLRALLGKMPGNSVMVGVGGITAGIVTEEAVRQMVRIVIAQAAARLTGGAMASGGAAATAVAAGGAGGTAVAPGVGTAVGVVGGFLVGAVVDWWMTAEFEEKVKADVMAFLSQTRSTLISGPLGLEAMLKAQVENTSAIWERSVNGSFQAILHPTPVNPAAP
jgi:hypothetical protein